jgi:hypothetical protein
MDLDGDGLGDMLVAIHTDDVQEPGLVRVFSGLHLATGGPLYLEQTIASIPGIPGHFGKKMALMPDVGGDGLEELLFSAPSLNNEDGAVLVLDSADVEIYSSIEDLEDTPANDLAIRLDGEAGEGLGTALAGGVWNGDGAILMGAEAASSGDGRAYLLSPFSSASMEDAVVFVGEDTGGMGASVAFVGDTDGDGLDEVAIGAPSTSQSFENAGAVYFYALEDLEAGVSYGPSDAIRAIHGEDEGQRSGEFVHGPGDLDGNGQSDLVIGATGLDAPEGWNEGGVFIWLRH